tara:strand:- start:6056 stop:6268 length:213 start_codon:yes stop_codon:yes gene_type:complete
MKVIKGTILDFGGCDFCSTGWARRRRRVPSHHLDLPVWVVTGHITKDEIRYCGECFNKLLADVAIIKLGD